MGGALWVRTVLLPSTHSLHGHKSVFHKMVERREDEEN